MTERSKVTLSSLFLTLALGLGLALGWTRPWESPDQRAVRWKESSEPEFDHCLDSRR